MKKVFFITGTDTGVGKTYFSYLLAKYFKEKGFNVGYYKPAETGCQPDCEDAKKLSEITGQNIDEIVLYKFKNPVAPLVAEREEKIKIDIQKIKKHLTYLKEKYDVLIVEGAGGIMVPITEKDNSIYTYLDFVKETNLPVIIVGRANLGTINHTVLTVNALKSVNAKIEAIILNQASKNPDLAEKTNPQIIKEMIKFNRIIKVYKDQESLKEF
jgi:dethiobiotin synthetase